MVAQRTNGKHRRHLEKELKMKNITLDEYIKLTGRKELIDEIKKRIGNNSDVINKLIVEIDENELNETKNKSI